MVIDPFACFFWALLLLLLPLRWLGAAVLAALIHEGCHLAALEILGYPPRGMKVGPFGAQMELPSIPYGAELAACLAGPAGSLALLLLAGRFPRLALCGLIHGLFNLLPVYPLDGGRAVYCFCGTFLPLERMLMICRAVGVGTLVCLTVGIIWAGIPLGLAVVPVILMAKGLFSKIPCKTGRPRVQ